MKITVERYRRAKLHVPWRVREWLRPRALAAGRFMSPFEEIRVSAGPGERSLIAVGDIAGCTPVEEHYLRGRRQAWGPVLPLLESADICVGNLEALLTRERHSRNAGGVQLRVDPAFAASLEGVFDGLTTANNHVLDFGPPALLESLGHLRSAGIATCGTGEDAGSAWQPCRLQAGDVQIGMLGCCDRYAGFPSDLAQASLALSDPESVRAAIRRLRQEVDLVVLQVHWGYEFSLWPLATHRTLARSFVDSGADLVLCHHAHVPMGVEAHGQGLIAYGLGNFLFRQDGYQTSGNPWTKRAIALRVEFDKGGVRRAEPIPVEMQSDYQIRPLEGSQRREVLGVLGHVSRRIEDTESLANLEHHCRLEETLSFLQRFRPTQQEHLEESLFRAGLLSVPIWTQTISYLLSGVGAAREAGNVLERIQQAFIRDDQKEIERCGLEVNDSALAGRLAAEMSLLPYQPATTPWWLP